VPDLRFGKFYFNIEGLSTVSALHTND
jgi:hypothetical protein